MILVFDTETGGLPLNSMPDDHSSQPHLVQLGGILYDNKMEAEIASFCAVVKPDGWTIPAKSVESHGITTERALEIGIPLRVVVSVYTNLRALSTRIVGHNVEFDLKIMRYAIARCKATPAHPGPSDIHCTMSLASPIVNLPPTPKMKAAGFTKPKPPTLTEATKFFFNEDLVGAHDAMVDVRACARIYRELMEHGHVK